MKDPGCFPPGRKEKAQGLKPVILSIVYGPTKIVPLYKTKTLRINLSALGAPFKPPFGLRGLVALDVSFPISHARPRKMIP